MSFTRRPKGEKKQKSGTKKWVFVRENADIYNAPVISEYTYTDQVRYLLEIKYVPSVSKLNEKIHQVFNKIDERYCTEGFGYVYTFLNRYDISNLYTYMRVQWFQYKLRHENIKDSLINFTGTSNDMYNMSSIELKMFVLLEIERFIENSDLTQEYIVYAYTTYFEHR